MIIVYNFHLLSQYISQLKLSAQVQSASRKIKGLQIKLAQFYIKIPFMLIFFIDVLILLVDLDVKLLRIYFFL